MTRIAGPSLYRKKKEKLKNSLDMLAFQQGTLKPKVKRKKRALETLPRKQPEAEFRKEVVRWLKGRMYFYKRVENSIVGRVAGNSMPDFLFATKDKFFFLELKSSVGRLSEGQVEFQEMCARTNTGHIVARSISDIEEAIKS